MATNDPTEGRDNKGKFVKGNRAGTGRPPNPRAMALRQVLLEEVTAADMRKIVIKLKDMAIAGDLDAIKDLLDRICGRATDSATIETIYALQEQIEELRRVISEQETSSGA